MAAPVHVITLAEALPTHLAEVERVLTQLADLCRQEEGCLRFDIYSDTLRPHIFNTIELWQSADHHRRHTNSNHVAKAVISLIGKVKSIPEIRVLDSVSELEA